MTVISFFKANYNRLKCEKINNGTESAGSPSPGPSAPQRCAAQGTHTAPRGSRSNHSDPWGSEAARLSRSQVRLQKAYVVFLINCALSGDLRVTKWCL